MKILFVNACIREEHSRTERLCYRVLEELMKQNDQVKITQVELSKTDLVPLDGAMLKKRNELIAAGNRQHAMFRYAQDFAQADGIVIGAPYWDLSFPALLKIYLEQVCVEGITFRYAEDGKPVGLCAAKRLVYVTTSGGYIGTMNFGYDYVRGLCLLFGIPETDFLSAEGLDIVGTDTETKLREAEEKIPDLLSRK